MTESEPAEDSKKTFKKSVGHIKMIVIPNLKAQTIDVEVTENIDSDASLTTDDSTSYVHFKDLVKEHKAQVIQPKDISKVLPWVPDVRNSLISERLRSQNLQEIIPK